MTLSRDEVNSWSGLSDADLSKRLVSLNAALSKQFKFPDINRAAKQELSDFWVDRSLTANRSVFRHVLELIRILARDSQDIACLSGDKMSAFITTSAGLNEKAPEDDVDVIMEAEKCLINLLYNSPSARRHFESSAMPMFVSRITFCAGGEVAEGAPPSSPYLSTMPPDTLSTLASLDLRLAFILTAHSNELQKQWRESVSMVSTLCRVCDGCVGGPAAAEEKAIEALKTLFNIMCHASSGIDERSVVCLMSVCVRLLRGPAPMAVRENTVNLMAAVPVRVELVCPPVEVPESASPLQFGGFDMTVVQAVMDTMVEKMTPEIEKSPECDLLGTYFTALIHICKSCKEARRYCRLKVLPPLTASEVERRPDEGESLRNKIIRVMSSPANCRELAAEFLFVLCKRSVNRLIKYSGLGHAAGLLANSGLLGAINEPKRASDSEDSETDEWKEVEPRVNPVTGHIREEREDVFAGMSEEQKEHEAMKLVNCIDRMMSDGLIKPGSIGADGKPCAVSHVMELLKDVPDQKHSDSDSD